MDRPTALTNRHRNLNTNSDSSTDALARTSADQLESAVGEIAIPGGATQMLEAMGHRHPKAMRMHPDAAPLDFETRPVPWYQPARTTVDPSLRLSRTLAYAGGDYYLQDGGSLLAIAAALADEQNPRSSDPANCPLDGLTVCDLCAAPGGKASAMLEAVGQSGFLLANEPIRSRIASLKYNLARTGSDRYAISSLDPLALLKKLGGVFDLVLVDAPCSGQALVGRGKQSSAAMTLKQVQHSAARQHRILDSAVGLLKPSGRLVYSTCTFATQENESQMTRLVDSQALIPNPIAALHAYQTDDGCYRLWPQLHDCAGAFASSMRLHDSFCIKTVKSAKQSKKKSKDSTRISVKQLPRDWQQWYTAAAMDRLDLHVDGSVLFGYVTDAPQWVTTVAVAGPELAYRTGQTWKPSHEASMRRGVASLAKHSVALDEESAAAYLTGGTVACDQRGWRVVQHEGRPMGWIKADGRIGKNHLPTSARW